MESQNDYVYPETLDENEVYEVEGDMKIGDLPLLFSTDDGVILAVDYVHIEMPSHMVLADSPLCGSLKSGYLRDEGVYMTMFAYWKVDRFCYRVDPTRNNTLFIVVK